MGTVRFDLRADKPLKNGKSAIDLVYQLTTGGTFRKKNFRTDIAVFAGTWDKDQQRVIHLSKKEAKLQAPGIDYALFPSATEVEQFNEDLKSLVATVKEIEKRFAVNKVEYNCEMVIGELKTEIRGTTKQDQGSNVLFEFMDRYIRDHEAVREPGSLSVYRSVKNHLQAYTKKSGRKVTFENIDYSFFQSFQNFLLQDRLVKDKDGNMITVPGLNNTTVAKQLSTVKTFLNYAKKQGIQVSDKYKDFKVRRENLEVIALTSEEFDHLFHLDLSGKKKLEETRDVFCFACCTGFRYSDLSQLRREHIKDEEIRLVVKKTKEPLTVPLTFYSRAILAKYEGRHKPLPVISNQNLNYNIKELCKYAGISEPVEIVRFRGSKRESNVYPKYQLIGVHTGRKTFVTASLEKGLTAEEVMSITGHKDYKSFKRYVNVTEQRKKQAMLRAWSNPSVEKLKAV